jgi:uncharacterized glyoxalase superfamily protein PhnB
MGSDAPPDRYEESKASPGMLVDQFGIPWMVNCEQAD